MSNLIGMDAGEVRTLAVRLRTQADAVQSVVSRIDSIVHQLAQSWQGSDAVEFVGWWQRQHRVALLKVHESLFGLAQSADNNSAQQDQTSAAGGGAPSGGSWVPPSVAGGLAGGVAGVMAFSNKWGFAAGPILTDIPKVGGPVGDVMQADEYFRLGQDMGEHHYQTAYDQGSGMAADLLMADKTPTGMLAGGDVIIFQHALDAERHVNWWEAFHRPGELDPFAPGALQAVGSAEAQGFKSLGVDLFQHSVGALLSL